MKTQFSIPASCFRLAACFCVTLWLVGCATQRVDWPARVGHYNYDQAVSEMGPPEKQATLGDGSLVAEWLINRGITYVQATPSLYWHYYGGFTTVQTAPSRYMRLTFGPDGQLAAWKKVNR